MINFRVRNLDAMLAQLRLKGADVVEETQEMEGVGRFAWVNDPEAIGSSFGSLPDRSAGGHASRSSVGYNPVAGIPIATISVHMIRKSGNGIAPV